MGNLARGAVFHWLRGNATMKHGTMTVLASAALLSSAMAGVRTDLARNPYEGILTRNAFALKPIPTPANEPATPPAPTIEVFLTGISTLSGLKKVLLQVEDKSPGRRTEYLPPLVENDVQGRIEVVSINAEKGEVVLKIDGQEKTLSFEKNAPKPSMAAPPATGPTPQLRPALPFPSNPALAAAATSPRASIKPNAVVVGGGPNSAGGSLPGTPSAVRSMPPVPTMPARR